MGKRQRVENEADLKGSEAKLLLHLMRRGDGNAPISELMRGSGVNDRETFFAARQILREKGWWENPTGIFPIGWNSRPGKPDQLENPTRETRPVRSENPTTVTETDHTRDISLYEGHPLAGNPVRDPELALPDDSRFTEPRNFREEAMQVDLMPGNGEANQRTSEFQARRLAQIQVLQDAWEGMFGQQLTRESAKDLLIQTENYAEDVLDAMETAQARKVESPRGYIMVMLKNKRAEKAKAQAPSAVHLAAIGSPQQQEEKETDYYLPGWTPETKRKMDILRRRGLLGPEEDD